MMKVGMIRSMQTEDCCPGTGDLQAVRAHAGAFQGEDDIEVAGFINCGGCPGRKVVLRARFLIAQGADTIGFTSCIQKGIPYRISLSLCQTQEGICTNRSRGQHPHFGLYPRHPINSALGSHSLHNILLF